jgi:magnesium transporter
MKHESSAWKGRRARVTPGATPGKLVGHADAAHPRVHVMAYGPDGLEEEGDEALGHVPELGRRPVTWVNIDGVGHVDSVGELGEMFALHPLALEDVVNMGQRAKLEPYDDHLFIVTRMPVPGSRHMTEQVSMFLGKEFVITFQERSGDVFEPVRERIRHGKGRIRKCGADYLAYALIDAVIDSYFPLLEGLGERLEAIEDDVMRSPGPKTVAALHAIKTDLLGIRRDIWPHREALGSLQREESPFIRRETAVFLRDCYDHNSQLIDLVQVYREVCSDLMSVYLSSVSNRMNEVMKVLTIIATIFIPLGFIAGLYGMNFNPERSRWNMPELNWAFGYPFALLLMLGVALGLVVFFKKKGWLGS